MGSVKWGIATTEYLHISSFTWIQCMLQIQVLHFRILWGGLFWFFGCFCIFDLQLNPQMQNSWIQKATCISFSLSVHPLILRLFPNLAYFEQCSTKHGNHVYIRKKQEKLLDISLVNNFVRYLAEKTDNKSKTSGNTSN